MHVPTVTRSPWPREETTNTMQMATLTRQRHHQWCRQSLPRAPPACPAAPSSPPYTASRVATIQAERKSQKGSADTYNRAGQNTRVKTERRAGRAQSHRQATSRTTSSTFSHDSGTEQPNSHSRRHQRGWTACPRWHGGPLLQTPELGGWSAHRRHQRSSFPRSPRRPVQHERKNRYDQWTVQSAQGDQARIVSVCICLPLAAPRSPVFIAETCTIPRQGAPCDASPRLTGPVHWRRRKRRSGVQSTMVWCRRTLHPHAAVLQKASAGKQEQRAAAEGAQTPTAAKAVTKATTQIRISTNTTRASVARQSAALRHGRQKPLRCPQARTCVWEQAECAPITNHATQKTPWNIPSECSRCQCGRSTAPPP